MFLTVRRDCYLVGSIDTSFSVESYSDLCDDIPCLTLGNETGSDAYPDERIDDLTWEGSARFSADLDFPSQWAPLLRELLVENVRRLPFDANYRDTPDAFKAAVQEIIEQDDREIAAEAYEVERQTMYERLIFDDQYGVGTR